MRTVRSSGRLSSHGGRVSALGGCLLLGVSALGGVSTLGGVSALGGSALGGVSVLGGVCSGGICYWGGLLWGGVCSRGCLLLGGCLLPEGGVVSQHALRQTPPCGQTHTCKNITFATSLQTVTSKHSSRMHTNRTETSGWVANKDEHWLSRHETNCGQNDSRLWKHYPLRSVIKWEAPR